MTTAKQLLSLQELDLALDLIQGESGKAQVELDSGMGLEEVRAELHEGAELLEEAQTQHKIQELETESQRERSARLDEQLYGGSITNPRDLESLEQEASHVRASLEQQDAKLLELTNQAEESRSKLEALETRLADSQSAWEKRHAELQTDLERWTAQRETIAEQRENLVETLDPVSVQRYEVLRKAKRGLAVAKVERGLCQACRMSLPTHQHQKVRSARETVLCSSCGRILCLG